jgi:hypothetical protein
MRIRCPGCQTEYDGDRIGVKSGPHDKALIFCKVCGAKLQVTAELVRTLVPGTRSWRSLWFRIGDRLREDLRFVVELLHVDPPA